MKDTILNYSEAREEADRLSRTLRRNVEVKTDMCCDFDKSCGTCGGQGYVYVLIYGFCEHLVPDGRDLECEEADCAEREYAAAVMREEELEAV